ncbi:MAG: SurA N-terminal domain-containing protein [Nanoarchaeota archaeon]
MKKKHSVKKHARISKSVKKPIILSVLVILIIIAAVGYLFFKNDAAATVNGEKIYEKRIDAIYNSLPAGSKISKEQILQQTIDLKILANYVEEQGFGLSDATFESEFRKFLLENGESSEDFEKNLALWGATKDDFKESMEISIFIKGVLENNNDAARLIIDRERPNASIVIYSKYQ